MFVNNQITTTTMPVYRAMIGYCQLMREHNTYYYDSLCIVPTALEQKSFVQAVLLQ